MSAYGMKTDGVLLLGLSGGADSSLLISLLPLFHSGAAVAVHVNHQIRGEAAESDEKFCRELCAKLEIPLEVYRIDVPALAKASGKGLEETGRDARRDCFIKTAAKYGADTLALAHNADDRAETLIFNLCRGAGMNGMCGIKPIGSLGRLRIIRPLIRVGKAEILSYCVRNGVGYVQDATNSDTDYTRNYIRHEILPRLERVNPAYLSNLNSACEAADECEKLVSSLAAPYLREDGRLFVKELLALPQPVFASVVSSEFERAAGFSPESRHIRLIHGFLITSENGGRLQLPGGVYLCRDAERVFFSRAVASAREYNIPLLPGLNEIPGTDMALYFRKLPRAEKTNNSALSGQIDEPDKSEYINIYKLLKRVIINSDIIASNLFIRQRLPADSYVYGGMTHSVSKLLSEHKVPFALRAVYPVVCDGNGILWVPPFSPRDGSRPEDDREFYEILCLYRNNERKETE